MEWVGGLAVEAVSVVLCVFCRETDAAAETTFVTVYE